MSTPRADGIAASGHTVESDERERSVSGAPVDDRVARSGLSWLREAPAPMDLRVSQRLVRPGSDTAMLLPQHHPLQLGTFSPQPCSPYSQQQLQQHIRFNMEQRRHEEAKEKQQELQQLWHKDKSQQSAVASSVVKQRLQEVIRSRQTQAALEKSHPNGPPRGYRELAPVPDVTPPSLMATPCDALGDHPLRRTASEPNLKVKTKLKKHLHTRKNPLTRKESAPPSVRHRAPDTMGAAPPAPTPGVPSMFLSSHTSQVSRVINSSPSSSSTPVSGCSSPNDSLPSENGVLPPAGGMSPEAHRMLIQDGTMAHFSIQNPATLPTITRGLPANAKTDADLGSVKGGRMVLLPGGSQVYLPRGLEDRSGAMYPHLQPLLVLEPSGLVHSQLVTVPGLGPVPVHFNPQLERLSPSGPHKPLSRTRSEPLPQNQGALNSHLFQQQLNSQFLERLKQHTHLGKLMSKSSEKPRLRQIPSEDMDSEEVGPGLSHTNHSRVAEPLHEVECVPANEDHVNMQHTLHQPLLWETQMQQLRRHIPHTEKMAVPIMHRSLSRTQSSPASTSLTHPENPHPLPTAEISSKPRFTTGLVYDSQMLKHQCTCGDNSNHPEHAGRIQSVWSRLQERGLRTNCERIPGRKATQEELRSVHSERHALLFGTNPFNRLKLNSRKLDGLLAQRIFVMLPCGGVGVDSDTIWNDVHTPTASLMAAGSVTELAFRVAKGELKNGFAVVRPPGHHAARSTPMGFCYFNSVAIAAKQLQQRFNLNKILIVDWDVHHGNGTQDVFYADPSVLYISLHRYDDGNFFPGSGAPTDVGSGKGEGFNINVAWTGGLDPPMGDAEYLAAFRTVVMPIAQEFCPDMVLVSSGFDAAEGHPAPLGGYNVSAKCFGFMTRQLMGLAGGKVVLILEGGHDLMSICDASEACVSALLGMKMEPLSEEVLQGIPCSNGVRSLQRVLQVHGQYWQSVKRFAHTVELSYTQTQRHDHEENATVDALASLSVGVLNTKSQPHEPMDHTGWHSPDPHLTSDI
ncbi:histone deacetylase 7-like isoform X2 [Conger conger]|uniref:histone deacetylase 7-like isoform X2 n=1 Tax=Conger conger TaxID=82655 RepID=UPI002A5A39BD|nr:histone deacetylase 7-like isoform X2 [Conger conger]